MKGRGDLIQDIAFLWEPINELKQSMLPGTVVL